MPSLRLCICLCLVAASNGAKVTPMEKVIGLLKDLSAKVTAEGKKEAAQYDKFACFCKEQADDKLYAIEKSDARIKDLKAEIEGLNADIAELNSEISELSKKISGLESQIDTKTKKRNSQHDAYSAKAKDMNEAIAACAAAIEALKDSKSAMSGAKVDLVQIANAAAKVAPNSHAVALISKLQGKAAPKFEYQSNDIIATLEELLGTFKSMKKDLDFAEHEERSAFEKNKLALSNEKKFAEKDRDEKEAIVEAKNERLNTAKEDRDQEQGDRDADQAFLDELTAQCETKAHEFDQRSSTRADELKALSDATAELQKGAAPVFETANKKLAGIQKVKAVKLASSVSFVQISNVQHQKSRQDAALQKVRSFLVDAADRSGSRVLSSIAVRVRVAEDHFVKVRELIKDLIAKLKADAEAEATQKGLCDTGMRKAVNKRDAANAKIEKANAKITTETSRKDSLNEEVATLESEIAELKKGLLEATELRSESKAENTQTVADAEAGEESVKLALGILREFYGGAALVQTKYVPPKSDREGNTVGDLAPEAFSGNYDGAKAESKGIIGILEVILSDFQRTNKVTTKEEKEAQDDFDKTEEDTTGTVDRKSKRIDDAEKEIDDAEEQILNAQGDLSEGQTSLEDALGELEKLEAMCVKGEETWEERKQKREDEIEALKNALEILENWQG